MSCSYIFKSGARKGKPCGKPSQGPLCSRHKASSSMSQDLSQVLDTFDILKVKFVNLDTTDENRSIIVKRMRYIETLATSSTEYQKNINWLREALSFPYNRTIETPVDINVSSADDISKYLWTVWERLDSYIYGMQEVKEDLLGFVCKRISNPGSSEHVLALQGSNGVGKTRLAHGLAKALDLPIRIINLGGVTDASHLVGHSYTYVDSTPGRIVSILNETQCKNCIIYFDELDKIHKTEKSSAIWSVITHLIDGTSNKKFQDMYLSGLNLDMSQVFFIFSFNDEELLDVTVKDRLKILRIKDPTTAEKIQISLKFLIPEILENLKFTYKLDEALVEDVVKRHSKKPGLREIKRVLEDILTKMNVLRLLNHEGQRQLSYYNDNHYRMLNDILERHEVNKDHMSMYV